MIGRIGRTALLLAIAGTVAGCASDRFGGARPRAAAARPAPSLPANEPPPVEAVPSGSVTSEPLAPPPGSGSGSGPSGTVLADVPSMPSVPPEPVARAAPTPSGAAGRSALVGSYTARDATGSSCRISLSGTSALDLYKASSTGCQNKDLGRITAWDFREGEVYLYQPGGSVAARLRSSGGELSGVLAKSGAPLTLAR